MGFAPFHPDTGWAHVLGSFVEKDCGHTFEFSRNDETILAPLAHGGKNVVYPHKVWVGPLGEYRYAKVGKTCIHVITDETDFGWIVQKWEIKNLRVHS
jgi:hypothetical protein